MHDVQLLLLMLSALCQITIKCTKLSIHYFGITGNLVLLINRVSSALPPLQVIPLIAKALL